MVSDSDEAHNANALIQNISNNLGQMCTVYAKMNGISNVRLLFY